MNKCRLFGTSILITVLLSAFLPTVLAVDTKYIHFRQILIDGDSSDWDGINSELINTLLKKQNATLVLIDNETFTPGNIVTQDGNVIVWKNLDENTTSSRKHLVALNQDAPFTWSSNALDLNEEDFLVTREVGNYSYHTSRFNWFNYPDGNITVTDPEWNSLSYGVSFASSQTNLYISLTIFNISDDETKGNYLKGIDIVMDDFADGSIQGDNGIQIEKTTSGYEINDMFFEGGELIKDSSEGFTDDASMAYSHEIPEFELNLTYLGDFFIEMEIPIDSDSIRDLGSSAGMSIGVEIILRISDTEQDINSQLIGVNDYFRGGGYPIIVTQHDEQINEMNLDPDEFFVVTLSGESFLEIISAILEEVWILLLSTTAVAFSLVFGGIVKIRKKRNRDLECVGNECDL